MITAIVAHIFYYTMEINWTPRLCCFCRVADSPKDIDKNQRWNLAKSFDYLLVIDWLVPIDINWQIISIDIEWFSDHQLHKEVEQVFISIIMAFHRRQKSMLWINNQHCTATFKLTHINIQLWKMQQSRIKPLSLQAATTEFTNINFPSSTLNNIATSNVECCDL